MGGGDGRKLWMHWGMHLTPQNFTRIKMKTLRLLEARVLGSSLGVQRKRGGPCSRIPPGERKGKREERRGEKGRGGKGKGRAEGRLGMYIYVRRC